MEHIYSNITTSITELKKSPTSIIKAAEGKPIALLNNNKTTAYIVPAKLYEEIMEKLDDINLAKMAKGRLDEAYVRVNLD